MSEMLQARTLKSKMILYFLRPWRNLLLFSNLLVLFVFIQLNTWFLSQILRTYSIVVHCLLANSKLITFLNYGNIWWLANKLKTIKVFGNTNSGDFILTTDQVHERFCKDTNASSDCFLFFPQLKVILFKLFCSSLRNSLKKDFSCQKNSLWPGVNVERTMILNSKIVPAVTRY